MLIRTNCSNCSGRCEVDIGAINICQDCIEELIQSTKDFEVLALQWKKGYSDLEYKSKVKIQELEQVIESLREDIQDLEKLFKDDLRD